MSQALESHVCRIRCWIPTGRRPPLGKALIWAGRTCCSRFHHWALLCKEETPASTALLAAAPVPGSGSSLADMLTRASFTRNVEACVLLVFLSCLISFQHTPSWQVMILVVIKSMVPRFLNGHKVKKMPRRGGRHSVQQMPRTSVFIDHLIFLETLQTINSYKIPLKRICKPAMFTHRFLTGIQLIALSLCSPG